MITHTRIPATTMIIRMIMGIATRMAMIMAVTGRMKAASASPPF